jgi:hypothetical protein
MDSENIFMGGGGGNAVVLAPVSNAVKKIPCSIADCEQGFNLTNVIITKLRTRDLTLNVGVYQTQLTTSFIVERCT